jgi:hypothetical protein
MESWNAGAAVAAVSGLVYETVIGAGLACMDEMLEAKRSRSMQKWRTTTLYSSEKRPHRATEA